MLNNEENNEQNNENDNKEESLQEYEELTFEDVGAYHKPTFGVMQRFMFALTSPSKLAEEVSRSPKTLLPLLLMMVLTMCTMVLNIDGIMEVQREALIQSYMQNGLDIPADGFDSMLSGIKVFTIVAAGVTVPIMVSLTGFIAHAIARVLGGKGVVKKIISMLSYSYIVVFIGAFLETVLTKITGLDQILFSPAMFMEMDITSPMYALMSSFDVFNIWFWGLGIIGIRKTEEISTIKAIIAIGVPVMIGIVLGVGSTLANAG